jgi:hypothetical protein
MRPTLIPIAILILRKPEGHVEYKAFSPQSYNTGSELRRTLYDRFMDKLYQHISYNPENGETNLGKLLEVHTRFIRVPIRSRGDTVHFNGYIHQYCEYMPVHGASPLQFTDEFICTDGLTHLTASHECI